MTRKSGELVPSGVALSVRGLELKVAGPFGASRILVRGWGVERGTLQIPLVLIVQKQRPQLRGGQIVLNPIRIVERLNQA